MSLSRWEQVEVLIDRIDSGEVVFFIGSGFSVDSEGNTTVRLMTRLLLRLQAFVEVLSKESLVQTDGGTETRIGAAPVLVESLFEKFRRTFGLSEYKRPTLKKASPDFRWSTSDLSLLAREYYAVNDWFCSTFDSLLATLYAKAVAEFKTPKGRANEVIRRLQLIATSEEKLRRDPGKPFAEPIDPVPLTPIHPHLPQWAWENRESWRAGTQEPSQVARKILPREAGKALFLDTMGFADPAVMGGKPFSADPRQLESSYPHTLFPRHHVLARLAREGLCPIVLTTNYDLLLEGAWRQAGFVPESSPETSKLSRLSELLPPTPLHKMARIGAPHEFVRSGKAIRTSLVVKVHGCAELYRDLRNHKELTPDPIERLRSHHSGWRKYLRSMVFTYREIQNWREDSWARDYLATIQRTRTVAFIGYSLQDPVLHDSFRNIYEEMSQHPVLPLKPPNVQTAQPPLSTPLTPAFFFAPDSDTDSFHGYEVLHAASAAVGLGPATVQEHDHYLRFHRRQRPSPATGKFPNLDDLFLWIYHRVIRTRQRKCLERELRFIARAMLPPTDKMLPPTDKRSPLPHESDQIVETFRQLVETERREMEPPDSPEPIVRRRWLQRTAGWTFHFHMLLLREIACIDQLMRTMSPQSLAEVRRHRWYFPVTANASWTAWAVVLELALRNLFAHAADPAAKIDAARLNHVAYPVEASCPTVLFRRPTRALNSLDQRPYESLRINLGRFERSGSTPPEPVTVGRQVQWTLRPNRAPWPTKNPDEIPLASFTQPLGRCEIEAPNAATIWNWSLGKFEPGEIEKFLGSASQKSDVRRTNREGP